MPSEARKRELKEHYKAMRPEMGVFVFRCVPTGKNYVGWTHDLKGTLNKPALPVGAGQLPGKGAAGGVARSRRSGVLCGRAGKAAL